MNNQNNPLLQNWSTPFGIPPFKQIKTDHFVPAIKESIKEARAEIDNICNNKEIADFSNTIEALERSGKKLNHIAATLFNLNSAETNSGIQKATQEASSLLTQYSNDISLNPVLFERVKTVYNNTDRSKLSIEQQILLKDKYKYFKNGGAELKGDRREHFRKITERLSFLSLKFEENVLAETNNYILHITEPDDLEGLPEGLRNMAAEEAKTRKKEGWIFTLHAPSFIPFMQYSQKRALRKEILTAYSSRANRDNKNNNTTLVKEIVKLRLELANILGYKSYADFVLEDKMAGSVEKVNGFLKQLFAAAFPFAQKDMQGIKDFALKKGFKHKIERWDWAFFSEWMKKELYNIDDEILRPYFKLDNVENAIFDLAGRLYGLEFKKLDSVPVYHTDVRAYEVIDNKRKHISVLLCDYHPRKGKSGGAWMTAYREQYKEDNEDIRPIVSIVMNFSKAGADKPALLSHNELTTLLHEFGHALHGMLSECVYESDSGTNVKRDFVELPSQLMENFAYESEWLNLWAYHYKTGEAIPVEIINKIKESLTYNEGYACNRQLSFGLLDMAWHTITSETESDVEDFEKKAMAETELFDPVQGACQSCAFGHLFSGGYAAGYYGYKWAEVLDADAFSLFKEKGIFNKEVASAFKENILKKGGSEDPMKLYTNFRGEKPKIDALLKRSGFLKK